LKLAGSRYITENIRSLPQLTLSKYIETIGVKDDLRPGLFIAAAIGHESLLRALFESAIYHDLSLTQSPESVRASVELCMRWLNGSLPIHQAAENGQNPVVGFLLSGEIGVNYKDAHWRRPLHYAARIGQNTAIKWLLENGATASAQDFRGYTAVHEAAQSGHERSVKLLLDKGADADTPSHYLPNNSATPLHLAVRNGHRAVVQLLLDNDAKINRRGGGDLRRTPLHHAAAVGNTEMVHLLLDCGAEVKGELPFTPITTAAANGHDTVIKLLLGKVTPASIPGEEIARAIFYAREKGHTTTLQLLRDFRRCDNRLGPVEACALDQD
jgi:ankyrin repeat protein